MTQEQTDIEQGNILIAVFMGAKIEIKDMVNYPNDNHDWEIHLEPHMIHERRYGKIEDLIGRFCKYHSSWDWLMPVVEKIATIEKGKFNVTILSAGDWACYIERDDVFEKSIADYGGFEPMILNVWKSVVKFIKWYNKKNKL